MEVGQEAIDEAEAIAWGDEEAGLAVEGPEPSVLAGRTFQKPERGRADGDDLPSPALHPIQRVSGFGRDRAMLGMHTMTFRVLRPHRQEGAGADVKRDEMLGNASARERSEQPAGEMKTSGRRGDRPL